MLEVEEYVEQRIKELVAFREEWSAAAKVIPSAFPKRLNEQEWYDRELEFNNVENGRTS